MNTIDMGTTLDNSEIQDKVTNFEKVFIKFKIELKLFENLKSGHKVISIYLHYYLALLKFIDYYLAFFLKKRRVILLE